MKKKETPELKFKELSESKTIRGGCWIWNGTRQRGKPPTTTWKTKTMTVRKCMYLIVNGIVYEPKSVHTTCGNLRCINPDHLTLELPKNRNFYND